jgi:hypothetical protein
MALMGMVAVVLVAPAAEGARASKPKEIVVVGSKLMETHARNQVNQITAYVDGSVARIQRLFDLGLDAVAEEAVLRVSERLRHKSRLALALVDGAAARTLRLLERFDGTQDEILAVQSARGAARRAILEAERRLLGILIGL